MAWTGQPGGAIRSGSGRNGEWVEAWLENEGFSDRFDRVTAAV